MWLSAEISTSRYLLLFDQHSSDWDVVKILSSTILKKPMSNHFCLIAERLPNKSCSAPPQPENGEWKLHPDFCKKDNAECKVPKDTRLRLGYQLIYNCSSGYNVVGDDKVYCTASGEWSSSPHCVENRCRKFREYTSTAIYSGSRLNDHVNDGGWYYFVPVNTEAELSCQPGYKAFGKDRGRSDVVRCNEDGNWRPSPIKCVPVNHDCGRQDFGGRSRGEISGLSVTDISKIPWQATLYKEKRSAEGTIKMFICGATLIRYDFVMTATHCVYNKTTEKTEDAGQLYVSVGNLWRDYDHIENVNGQKSVVRKVHLPFDYPYQYNYDIALLELQEPFDYHYSSWPACLDPSSPYNSILEEGAFGIVAGFVRTATEDSSPTLQALTAPYVSYSECEDAADVTADDEDVSISSDEFCAGYTNETVVCDGDNGGGIVFSIKNVSYVTGVFSVSLGVDLSNDTRTCSKHALTLYTYVTRSTDWIREVVFDQQRKCVSPEQPTNGQWKLHPTDCTDLGRSADCSVAAGVEFEAGTTLVYSCSDGYKASKSTGYRPEDLEESIDVYCTRSGSWSDLPECVTSSPSTNRQQPVDQEETSEIPWQASVYVEKKTPKGIEKQFQCVATTIKDNLLLAARACVHDQTTNATLDPQKLFVMVGNIYPDYDSPLHDPDVVRKSRVFTVYRNCTYAQRIGSNRLLHGAVLLQLEQPLQFTGKPLPQPLPEVEGHSEVLLDDYRNVFIFKTAGRGLVICHNNDVINFELSNRGAFSLSLKVF